MLLSILKEELSYQLLRYSAILMLLISVSVFSPILMRFSSNRFIVSVAFIGFSLPVLLQFAKNIFLLDSVAYVCIYRNFQFLIYAMSYICIMVAF